MFYLTGVGLALFLVLLLFTKQRKTQADWILACWLLFIGLHLFTVSAIRMAIFPQLLGIDLPLPVIHGPFLYLYTQSLTGKIVSGREFVIHFALPIAFYVYLFSFIAQPADQKLFVYENHGIGYETFLAIRAFCIPLSGILYIVLSLITLRRHQATIVNTFSSVEKVNLNWLLYLIMWLAVIWLMVMFADDNWVFGTTVIFLFFIGFFGIRQGVIFKHAPFEQPLLKDELPETVIEDSGKKKYQKSGLTSASAEALHAQLKEQMAREKFYKDGELTLLDLAERMNVPPNHLSQVINEREGKSFYDYINGLRTDEFMRAVREPDSQRLTLFAIAQACGFNSKSSFNRYFKKVTGQSPSAFMDAATTPQN